MLRNFARSWNPITVIVIIESSGGGGASH